jgi:polar amino acid transport system substrate-binding protein
VNGRAEGFLVKLTRKLFLEADIPVTFAEMPPKRIIKMIKIKKGNFCSIGWFKNPEREAFAKFSLPIYQNKPIVIMTTKNQQKQFQSYRTLKDVFSDKTIVLGIMSEFSYGPYIDDLMKNNPLSKIEITSKQSMIPGLIQKKRAHFTLISPEDIETLLQSAGYHPDDFLSISMPDIPAGNKRYLMFSKGVSDETIEKINQAIRKHVLPSISE